MKVSNILDLQKNLLITLPPNSLLSDAVILMAEKDIGSVVIVEKENALVGMLTFREVIRILAKRQIENRSGETPTMSEIKVNEVMNSQPTVTEKDMQNRSGKFFFATSKKCVPKLPRNTWDGASSGTHFC